MAVTGQPPAPTDEQVRLRHSPGDDDPWRLWGPYLSARQWGTVREDYSDDGDAWAHFPFDQAHARAYRWGEDGIAGLTDRYGFLNLAVAAWNHRDDRLKERLFGLTNAQGNHGEDAKEYWWALDATPTHSWAQHLYRYPQAAFPYATLVEENARRGPDAPELQLADTGVLQAEPLLRHRDDARQGRPGRRLHGHRGDQPRPGCRPARPRAAAVVPQHVVLGAR
jgi:hypothetical protein